MSSFWNFLFGAILVVIWIVAGGYVTQASVYLTSYRNNDDNLNTAYWFTFWAAFVTWFLVGVFIILVILSIIGVAALFGSGVGEVGLAAEGAEGAEFEQAAFRSSNTSGGFSWLTIIFLLFALGLVITTGVLSAIAANSIAQSPNYDPNNDTLKTAYTDCIIAASMCLAAAGILIIGTIIYFIIGIQAERKRQRQLDIINKRRSNQLQSIEQLKQEALKRKLQQDLELKEEVQRAKQAALIQKVYQQALK